MKYLAPALVLALGAVTITASAGSVRSSRQAQSVAEKIPLAYQSAEALVRSFTAEGPGGSAKVVPTGVVILGYPLDNALIVRGPEAQVAEFRRLVRIIDRPTTQQNGVAEVWITLERAKPETVSLAARALPGAGAVELASVAGKERIAFKGGSAAWRQAALSVVMAQELAATPVVDAPLVNPPGGATSAASAGASAELITVKVRLEQQDGGALLRSLAGNAAPSGAEIVPPQLVILGYPRDNSLIVRGRETEVAEFRRLITILDVPVEVRDGHTQEWVTLDRAKPESVAAAARALAGAGTVKIDNVGRATTVGFVDGSSEWRRSALRIVAAQEHAAATGMESTGPAR